jgi:NAD(P)-dependent dehydrogenase (short-subunit alcohol dehydrogenase family)
VRDAAGARGVVETYVEDLSSLDAVRSLADEVGSRHPRLDVLVNNVGGMFVGREETVDGLEMTLALNHLGPYLLTRLLLDVIRASGAGRIVSVSSEAHRGVKLRLDDLQMARRYHGFAAYGRSKLANILFVKELARRLESEGSGVTANALHPGFVRTGFFDGNGGVGWVARRVAGLFAIAPEAGAATSVYLAGSPEVAGVTGRYFIRCREATPSKAARDMDAARALWDASARLVGLEA